MPSSHYSHEFWDKVVELASQPYKECEKCHFPHGWQRTKKSRPLVVTVQLRSGDALVPDNLGLFCDRCKRKRPKRTKEKVKDESLF